MSTIEGRVLTYHRIAEVFKFAYARRSQLGDEDFVNVSKVRTSFYSSFPTRGRLSGLSISIRSYLLHPRPSTLQPLPCPLSPHPHTSFYSFPVSCFLAVPSSASFTQYTKHLSSVHIQTPSVLPLVFSLQTAPPALSP